MSDSRGPEEMSVRAFGEAFRAKLDATSEIRLRPEVKRAVLDVIMGVLARHAGTKLLNDSDLPVTPLPRKNFPGDESR